MEQKLLFLINREWISPAADKLMALMSSLDFWFWPLTAAIVLVFILGGFKARAMLLVLALIIGISDGLVADTLKKIVRRPRPHEMLADVRRVELRKAAPRWMSVFKQVRVRLSPPNPAQAGSRSFPSAHTVDNFAAAVVLTAFYRRLGALWFLIASLVAYSRIYVGSHWPSDIVVSVFLGGGIACLLLPLCEMAWRKIGARWLPDLFAAHPRLIDGAAR